MNFRTKTKIIISVLAISAWVSLFAVFYFNDTDYGIEPKMDFGDIRGAAVLRFKMEKDEIILFSKHGELEHKNDVLLVSSSPLYDGIILRVISGKSLMFEQRFGYPGVSAIWDLEKQGFKVELKGANSVFWIIPDEDKYDLIW